MSDTRIYYLILISHHWVSWTGY